MIGRRPVNGKYYEQNLSVVIDSRVENTSKEKSRVAR